MHPASIYFACGVVGAARTAFCVQDDGRFILPDAAPANCLLGQVVGNWGYFIFGTTTLSETGSWRLHKWRGRLVMVYSRGTSNSLLMWDLWGAWSGILGKEGILAFTDEYFEVSM